jgi:hypothetical protein
MYVTPEAVNQFFVPLVGDPDKSASLDTLLREAVAGQHISAARDPYERLNAGCMIALREAGSLMPDATRIDRAQGESLLINGETGVRITTETLKTLGGLHAKHADTPQRLASVGRNVSKALRHVYGTAFTDSNAATDTLWANKLGLNPNNRLVQRTSLVGSVLTRGSKHVSPRTFATRADEDGQLLVVPRYSRAEKQRESRCPAVDAKVITAEGPRTGLLVFMKTIGTVAVEEIYAGAFPILDQNGERLRPSKR